MSLTRLSVDNPVVVGILAAVVIAIGVLASANLGIVFLPDITAPVIEITASYPGAAPAEMEQLVVKPIEDQIVGLHNEDTMQASVQEGQTLIAVQLTLGADV
ncbi:MAG TPA: efflux RND transporter permease subunit, partial [Vicinamibacterales bacterium]|nr:efflux RND transporter permease subunit [Vicinamibacterales bacterium]